MKFKKILLRYSKEYILTYFVIPFSNHIHNDESDKEFNVTYFFLIISQTNNIKQNY